MSPRRPPTAPSSRGAKDPRPAPQGEGPVPGVIGLGHVGLATAVAFAHYGHRVLGLEADPGHAQAIARGEPWFQEPGLREELRRALASRRLEVAPTREVLLVGSSVLLLCLPTPSRADGAVDLRMLEEEARTLSKALQGTPDPPVVVVKSTSPPETARRIRTLLNEGRAATLPPVPVAVNPEFLAEGTMVKDSLHPSRIVVGAEDRGVAERVLAVYQGFPGERVFLSPEEASLAKYACNALLASRVSFVNELSRICERSGADVYRVAQAVGLDPRIGPDFLRAGPGFGGSCFPKDLRGLEFLGRSLGEETLLLRAIQAVNEGQSRHTVDRLEEALGLLAGRTLALLGLSFKAGTDDVRESRAFPILGELLKRGALARLHDPEALENFRRELPALLRSEEAVKFCPTLEEALEGSDAALVLVDWPEYRAAPATRWAGLRSRTVLDARRSLDEERLRAAGVRYLALGRDPRIGPGRPEPPSRAPRERRTP